MIIATAISSRLKDIAPGRVFTLADFDVSYEHQRTLAKALNRRVQKGELKKISKGKFFKPQITTFGEVNPDISEIIKDYLRHGNEVIGYVTGTQAFAKIGLTTQISTEIIIATNNYKRPKTSNGYTIRFISQKNKIEEKDIYLLRILDAFKFINEISGTTPSEVVVSLIHIIREIDNTQRKQLSQLAKAYPPKVRALLGAILEHIGFETQTLMSSLNGLSTYKIGISENILPTAKNWNIK